MALVKTSKRSHGPVTYILEITEAEARDVLLTADPDSGLYAGLAAVLPPPTPKDDAGYGADVDGTQPSRALPDETMTLEVK